MDYSYEQNLIDEGYKIVCGVDEVGRGPMAGPIVASAVVVDSFNIGVLNKVNDSKALNEEQRQAFFYDIINNVTDWAVGIVSHYEIDKWGIAMANSIVMKRAVQNLKSKPDYVLSDFGTNFKFDSPFETIVKGDAKVLSIAAASIIAKVTRDRIMDEYSISFPGYGFARHKGYGTQVHMKSVDELGPCAIHRKSFGRFKPKLF